MKQLIVLLFTALVIISCNNDDANDIWLNDNKNNLKTQNLKGNVKSVVETFYETTEGPDSTMVAKPDWEDKTTYTFDDAGNLLKELRENFDTTTSGSIWTYQYNKDNFLTVAESHDPKTNELYAKHFYKFDEHSNNTEHSTQNSEGKVYSKFIYSDFENHQPKTITHYDDSNKIEYIAHSKFDKARKVGEKMITGPTGEKLSRSTITFDDKGNVLTIYDVSLTDSTQKMNQSNKYDDFGNLTEIVKTEDKDYKETTTIKYEYDTNNNWIKKTRRKENETIIVIRKIEYK